MNRTTKERQRVHLAHVRIDERRVVPFPARLILLGPTMMIHGEQHRARQTSGLTQPNRGTTAIRTNLEKRSIRNHARGGQCRFVQCVALVGGHEPDGGQGGLAQPPRDHQVSQ